MVFQNKIMINGYITQYRWLDNRNLFEIESRLGFRRGRMAQGAAIYTLDRMPRLEEFETAGYSNVASHHHVFPAGFDREALKKMAMSVWTPTGPNRLVKVVPKIPHRRDISNDVQYPPGEGVPQWNINPDVLIPGTLVAVISKSSDRFKLAQP